MHEDKCTNTALTCAMAAHSQAQAVGGAWTMNSAKIMEQYPPLIYHVFKSLLNIDHIGVYCIGVFIISDQY